MKARLIAPLFLVLALLLSACNAKGGNEGATNSGSQAPTASSAASSEASKPQTPSKVTWFATVGFWNPPSVWNTDPKTVPGAITEKTGLTFEFNIPAQDAETKLNLMLVSNNTEIPDVLTLTNEVLGKKLIEAGKVWDIDEFLKKYDPDSHLLKEFPADVKETIVSRDGSFAAFPSHISSDDARKLYPPSDPFFIDGVKYRENNAIIVNEKLMKEAGITIEELKTEDGLLAAYKKIKDMKLTVDGAPIIPLMVDGKTYQDSTLPFLLNSFGAMPVDKDGNYRDPLLAPEMKYALEFLYKAAKGRYFEPGQLTVDTAAVRADVTNGKVFSFIGNSANTHFAKVESGDWVSPGPILSNKGTKPVLPRTYRAGGGWMKTYISKTTKEPEKLAKWLSFMSSKEGMLLHIYGIEGVHYNLNEQGLVVKTEQGVKDATDYATTGLGAYWPFHNGAFSDHVSMAPTEETDRESVVAVRVSSTYGKAPETVPFDHSALWIPEDLFPADSKLFNDKEQIKIYKEAQISKIIMAKDDASFNKLYDEMIAKFKELGIEAVNAGKNDYYQQKTKEYGIDLVKGINS